MAEPAPLARLVQQLLAKPPAACEGLAWFRFPHASDELAWSWPTLRAVMAGRVPEPRLVLNPRPSATGTLDLFVQNDGEAGTAPSTFRVTWRDAPLLAADGLAGWQVVREGPFSLLLRPPAHGSNGQLRPGDVIGVGWLRFDRPAEIHADALP